MRFDGSLGNVQIASDFRVVTSLKKQIDDLPFPGTHLVELFFHIDCTWPMQPGLLQVAKQSGLPAHLDSGLCVSFCIHAAKSGPRCQLTVKIPVARFSACKNKGYYSVSRQEL